MDSLPIMAYKLHIMSRVAGFDAIDTYGITICCVTRLAPEKFNTYFQHLIHITSLNENSL